METIKIRTKLVAKETQKSYYLDYVQFGRRHKEYLKLYTYTSPKDKDEKEHNKKILYLVKSKANEKERELMLGKTNDEQLYGVKLDNFFDFMDSFVKSYAKGDKRMFQANLKYVEEFWGKRTIKPQLIDSGFCKSYKAFLDAHPKLNGSTSSDYFSRFKRMLKVAVEEKMLMQNPAVGIVNRTAHKSKVKDVLTPAEIKILAQVPCGNEESKKAFLTACHTGLRFCDVKALCWKNICGEDGMIRLVQAKTGEAVSIPIHPNIKQYFEVPSANKEDLVFDLPTHNAVVKCFRNWLKKSGIHKKITFHCGRHSFGTNLVENGTDILTVGRMLGHTTLKHTVRYTRTSQKQLKEAIGLLPEY